METSVSIYGLQPEKAVANAIQTLLSDYINPPVLLCIGSDKVTGDCLGPIIGYFLTKKYNVPAYVYGTLDYPITAKNLCTAFNFISKVHPHSKILAIDAALSNSQNIGLMFFRNCGLKAGSALSKNLPNMGDYSITAVVNTGGKSDSSSLFSTSLHTVITMAEYLASGLSATIKNKKCCV